MRGMATKPALGHRSFLAEAHANIADVRLNPYLGSHLLFDGGHFQNRNTYKQIRAAALAEWRGLLAA